MDDDAASTAYPAYATTPSTIAALSAYAAEICNAEVARALARLGEVSARDALIILELADRLVRNLLQRPMTVLNTDAEGENAAQVVRQLFQLEGELPASPSAEQPTGLLCGVPPSRSRREKPCPHHSRPSRRCQ